MSTQLRLVLLLPSGATLAEVEVQRNATGAEVKAIAQNQLEAKGSSFQGCVTADARLLADDDVLGALADEAGAAKLQVVASDRTRVIVKHMGRSTSNAWGYRQEEDVALELSASDTDQQVRRWLAQQVESTSALGVSTRMEGLCFVSKGGGGEDGGDSGAKVKVGNAGKMLLDYGFVPGRHELVVQTNTLVAGMVNGRPDGTFNSSIC